MCGATATTIATITTTTTTTTTISLLRTERLVINLFYKQKQTTSDHKRDGIRLAFAERCWQ